MVNKYKSLVTKLMLV